MRSEEELIVDVASRVGKAQAYGKAASYVAFWASLAYVLGSIL